MLCERDGKKIVKNFSAISSKRARDLPSLTCVSFISIKLISSVHRRDFLWRSVPQYRVNLRSSNKFNFSHTLFLASLIQQYQNIVCWLSYLYLQRKSPMFRHNFRTAKKKRICAIAYYIRETKKAAVMWICRVKCQKTKKKHTKLHNVPLCQLHCVKGKQETAQKYY